MPLTNDTDIAQLLSETRTIAVIGASDRPGRPSNNVLRFLVDHGYRVFPVNPTITGEHIHGQYVWRELDQIGEPGEAQLAMFGQHLEHDHRPFVRHAPDHLGHQRLHARVEVGIIMLRRGRHSLSPR